MSHTTRHSGNRIDFYITLVQEHATIIGKVEGVRREEKMDLYALSLAQPHDSFVGNNFYTCSNREKGFSATIVECWTLNSDIPLTYLIPKSATDLP